MTKMQPYTSQWHDIADGMRRCYAPRIYPCGTCGYPVMNGFCCSNCHSMNPQDKPELGNTHD